MTRRIGMGFDWQGSMDRERALKRAQIADEVGIDSIWVAEAWGQDAFTTMVQLVERTKNVQVGTGIVNIYSRTPAALAQHFATIDELSEGRVIVGLGNSGPQVIEHFHGVPFQPAFKRMRETVEIMKILFAGERLNYDGDIFKLQRGFTLRFETYRKQLPIYLATLNPKSVRMTAEISDGWLPIMIPMDRLKEEIDQIHDWVREAGKDPADFTVRAPGGVTVTNTPEAKARARAGQAGRLPSIALAWASSTTDSSHGWVTRTKPTPPALPGKTAAAAPPHSPSPRTCWSSSDSSARPKSASSASSRNRPPARSCTPST